MNLQRCGIESFFPEQLVYLVSIAFYADMPLVYLVDRPRFFVVVDGEDHRAFLVIGLECPFDSSFMVR